MEKGQRAMDIVIGIDLGTSTTEAAVYRDGKPEMIVNLSGDVIIPSAVGVDNDGNWIVGDRARAQLLLSPENTAIEIKRKIGTGEAITIGGTSWTASELSSHILEYVRGYVSKYLGEDVKRAVISVPAYFNEIQRQETMAAGRKAGFEVERILNEPTAAALSYGLDHMEEESHVLVYDLGGGTFDVTLLEMFDGVLEVKASSGDNQLGGKDFDELICSWMVEEFRRKTGIDPQKDSYAMVRMKDEAEKCKRALSTQDSYHILLPALMKKQDSPLDLDLLLTAEQFEKMAVGLLERTHHPIDVVMSDAGISEQEIDRVILVGGATRMPMVAKEIERFIGIRPEKVVNPDYAVAQGAAIQAAMISGEIDPREGLIMTDVNPFSLGVRCSDGFTDDRMSIIIPRNVTIPVTRKETYVTAHDYQTKALIEVYQGESDIATSNHFLGRFEIDDIPAHKIGREGGERIVVSFTYDLNGMLQVEALVAKTGRKASIRIDMMNGDEDDPDARIDVSGWKKSSLASDWRMLLRRAERELKKLEIDEDEDAFDELEEKVYRLKRAILKEDKKGAQAAGAELERLLSESFH